MVKELNLGIYYLGKSGRGFAQIIQIDLLRPVSDGLKSKRAGAFLLFKVCPNSIF
jgi:hypothetical protein